MRSEVHTAVPTRIQQTIKNHESTHTYNIVMLVVHTPRIMYTLY
jgi:hypothetical protein